jgi:uncharacterized membrane protein YfcA
MLGLVTDLITLQFLTVVGIVIIGGIVHGYTGSGGALVMMPLLTFNFSPY